MTVVAGLRTWTLEIPAPAKMHSANTTAHWRRTYEAKRLWRAAAYTYAVQAKLPKGLDRVRIDVVLHFTVNRNRDDENWSPYVGKPIADGLAKPHSGAPGYLLIADDNSQYLSGPFCTVGVKVAKDRFPLGLAVVTITELVAE